MTCYIPYGSLTVPQENLKNCHGELKEELQDVIIKKMHTYILDHIGEINKELEKPL